MMRGINSGVKSRMGIAGRNAKTIPGRVGFYTGRAIGNYGNLLKNRGVQLAAAGAGGWGAKSLYDKHKIKSRMGAAVRAFKGAPKTPKTPNPSWKSGKGLDSTRLKNMMNQLNRPGITL